VELAPAAVDPVCPTALHLPTCLPTIPQSIPDATGEVELRLDPVAGDLPPLNPMAAHPDNSSNSINSTTIARALLPLLPSLPSPPLARRQVLSLALVTRTIAHRPR
jgi:hypothetical protein